MVAIYLLPVTLNNASGYRTIWDVLMGYRTRVRVRGPIVRCIIRCDPIYLLTVQEIFF